MRKNPISPSSGHAKRTSAGHGVVPYILAGILGIVVVGWGIVSVVDMAGDSVAGLAARFVREQTGMLLSVRGARGNPVKGYTFEEVSLASEKGQPVFSAETLGVKINFMSLLRASPRLSLLAVGGVDMDLDRFIEEAGKIRFAESSGGGEIPIDRVRLQDSRFTSKWGEVAVAGIEARLKGSSIGLALDGAVNGVPVKGTLDLNVQAGKAAVDGADLSVGRGQSPGKITVAGSANGAFLDFQGSIRNLNVSEICAFWPAFLASADYEGKADADFSIEGAGSDVLIAANLGFTGSRLGGYPVENLSVQAKYSNMRLSADSVKATSLGIPIEGSAALAMHVSREPSVMLKLKGGDAPLSELAKLYPALGRVDGKVDRFAIDIQGPSSALSGTIDFSVPSAVLRGKRVENFAVQVKLAKSDSASVSGKFTLEGSQGYVQGSVKSLLSGAVLNLTANLRNLDVRKVADLIPDGKKWGLSGVLAADLALEGKMASPAVSGKVASPKFTAMGYTLDSPSLSFAWAKDVFTLRESGGSWNGIPVEAKGTMGPLSSKTPQVSLTAQLTLEAGKLSDSLRPFVPDIDSYKLRDYDLKGKVGAGVKVTGTLPNPKIDLLLSSPALSALGAVSAKGLEVTAALTGDMGKLDLRTLTGTGSLRSAAASLFGIKLSNAVLPLSLAGNTLKSEGGTLTLYGGKVVNTLTLDLGTMTFSDSLEASGVDVNALARDAAGGLGGKITGKGNLSLKLSGGTSPRLSYSGSGQFTMGEGAISGFSGLDILTRLHGVDGIRYTKVTAPLRIETNKLILAKGSSAEPPQNDPLYRSARLAEDGTVTFDKKLYFVADLNVNFQLLNALTGGAAGGLEALIGSGGVNVGKQLESLLKGAVAGGREQGKEADFRDATVKVTGTSVKPAIAIVKVGPSSKQDPRQKQREESAAAERPAQKPKPEEAIRDKIIDAIVPRKPAQKPENQKPEAQKPEAEKPEKKPQRPASPESLLEEQLRKGIDGLLKKK
jgi:translocation and assembly module TamB